MAGLIQGDISLLALGEAVSEAFLYVHDKGDAEAQIKKTMVQKAAALNVTLSEPIFEDVGLDDQRLVDIGDDWPRETRCIIGTARITMLHGKRSLPGAEFLKDCDEEDLIYLRKTTRDIAKKYGQDLSDVECDEIIAERGPQVAEKALSRKING